MKRLLPLLLLSGMVLCWSNQAKGYTWYHNSTCTVKSEDSSKGLVYVSDKAIKSESDIPFEAQHSQSIQSSKQNNSSTDGGQDTHTYYLYAKPLPGYVFNGWTGKATLSEQNTTYAYTHSTYTKDSTPTTGSAISFTAHFIAVNAVNKETNIPAGTITLEPEAPQIGDKVTASTFVSPFVASGTHTNKNMMVEFDHWEMWVNDEKVKNLGTEEIIEFEVEEPMTLKAIYKELGETPQTNKYYRVRNAWNRVLTVEGNYSVSLSNSSPLDNTLLRWALPYDFNPSDFYTDPNWIEEDPINVEAHPGTIFYVSQGNAAADVNGSALTSVILTSQGVNTQKLTGQTMTIVPMTPNNFPGYYGVKSFAAGQEVGFKATTREMDGKNQLVVFIAGFSSATLDCALAVQPIDEEHIDIFWFGADADDDMEFEDGYWTTMYTAFPYKVYEKDDVEAYYVTQYRQTVNGVTYFNLVKIEDGIVPANQAVLLKCSVPNDTKSNRLIPLNPSDVNKTTLEGNILKGSFQLYTNKNKNGRESFDPEKMRVLGLNNDGIVGFYKLTEGTELSANKAYLDLSQIPAEARSAALRITSRDFITGVETIEDGMGGYERDIIYDLMGNRVVNPQPGTIYIVNGKKILWR